MKLLDSVWLATRADLKPDYTDEPLCDIHASMLKESLNFVAKKAEILMFVDLNAKMKILTNRHGDCGIIKSEN